MCKNIIKILYCSKVLGSMLLLIFNRIVCHARGIRFVTEMQLKLSDILKTNFQIIITKSIRNVV